MVAEPGSVQFSIGRVIGSSLGVYARNFISFSILALLIGAISLVVGLTISQDAASIAAEGLDFTSFAISMLVMIVVNSMTQAAIVYGTFQDLRGQKAGIGDCIARGIATMIPVIFGSILLSLAVGIASLFLLIPGIILMLMWWVYVPVLVVEGSGIMGGFSRASELTRGRRWHILGLIVVVFLLSFVVNFTIGLVFGVAVVASGDADSVLLLSIVQYIAIAIVTAFSAILVAVGYYYLRAEKEGVDVDAIAQVFD